MLNMTKIQKDLYKLYINQFLKYEGVSDNGKMSGINVLVSFAHLSKIWNHPKILVDCVTEPDVDINDFDDLSVKHDPKQQKKSKKAKSYKSDISGLLWSKSFIENDLKDEHMFQLLHSPKFVFAISLIDEALKLNEKIVLFSMSLMTLNLFEKFLHKRKTNGEYWKKGVSYYRMDGSTHLNERHSIVKSYNDPENKVPLCLLSTKAVCLGINLVAASRAIIMDVNWNPCMDRQALFRIYRYGQNKPVSIYRLISFGTMENRIYNRQIAKQEISERVVDENYPFSRCSYQDLSELLKYKEDTLNIPINPEFRIKDRLLSIVIRKNVEHMAMLPFEHDSLFIEQDVKLSKTEEKHAEMSYQVEMKKKGIAVSTPKIPLPSNQNLFPIVLSDDSLSNLESSDNCIDSDSSIEIL
ncbi:hypothetical protein A3Q56_04030 [Intoshia linei]|uniref:Helicase C-terminal domain-containing protein n=1 Tax=Intoshia linei TaxID=1819745 RepID=A0A177B1T2_9BILA|nr:hypothetical protein A3Q56_04030 [Intoshia linei]